LVGHGRENSPLVPDLVGLMNSDRIDGVRWVITGHVRVVDDARRNHGAIPRRPVVNAGSVNPGVYDLPGCGHLH
jgi:hypothetical protein